VLEAIVELSTDQLQALGVTHMLGIQEGWRDRTGGSGREAGGLICVLAFIYRS
jgi:hypothetical protein